MIPVSYQVSAFSTNKRRVRVEERGWRAGNDSGKWKEDDIQLFANPEALKKVQDVVPEG